MSLSRSLACSIVLAGSFAATCGAQAPASEEKARSIAGGGITVPGWQGMVDANAAKQGQTVQDDKFSPEGNGFHVTTGPAVDLWSTKNVGKGDFTVSATFNEPKFMNLNSHPHPYGVFLGGNDMGTPQQSLLYCATYGNGTFIIRGFGPDAFQVGGRQPQANPAVHKVEVGQPVTQTISMSVKGDSVSCSVNGTEVAKFPKSDVVADGKLKSTDGVVGIRFAHNTDAIVTGFKVSK